MKKLTLAIATAAVPVTAFGVHVGVGPVGVGVGVSDPYYGYNRGYWNNYCNSRPYYDYYDCPSVIIGGRGWHGDGHWHGHR